MLLKNRISTIMITVMAEALTETVAIIVNGNSNSNDNNYDNDKMEFLIVKFLSFLTFRKVSL